MKILYVFPSFKNAHGGTRVAAEHIHGLQQWHQVDVLDVSRGNQCDWMNLNAKFVDQSEIDNYDLIIIGSPHGINYVENFKGKVLLFAQMAEHLFYPSDRAFYETCKRFYGSNHPMISISHWNMHLFRQLGRTARTYYVENGINPQDFPIEKTAKDRVVLLESPTGNNPTKDTGQLAIRAAKQLKQKGYKVLAYGRNDPKTGIIDEFYQSPDLQTLNELYARAKILIKATVMDAQSTAPLEAMTKGTPTARAINSGDDQLIHNINCVRGRYNMNELNACIHRLLSNDTFYNRIAGNCIKYAQDHPWEPIINQINQIITSI